MADANDLQRVFETKASDETKVLPKDKYVVHSMRRFLHGSSRLDPIYDELGKTPLNYQNVRKLIDALELAKKDTKYKDTLKWLKDVLGGDYTQIGNGCGAWSLTHFKMKSKHEYYLASKFTGDANAYWAQVQFNSASWDVAKLGAVPSQLTDWEKAKYSNPWKVTAILGSAVGHKTLGLKIDKAAETFARSCANAPAVLLNGMLDLINNLSKTNVPQGDLTKLPAGEKAIIIGIDASKAPPRCITCCSCTLQRDGKYTIPIPAN